ncbi:MAG: hypothetical protein ACPGMT_07635, partial [Candidatus Puniceispirillaceae bacterium]
SSPVTPATQAFESINFWRLFLRLCANRVPENHGWVRDFTLTLTESYFFAADRVSLYQSIGNLVYLLQKMPVVGLVQKRLL